LTAPKNLAVYTSALDFYVWKWIINETKNLMGIFIWFCCALHIKKTDGDHKLTGEFSNVSNGQDMEEEGKEKVLTPLSSEQKFNRHVVMLCDVVESMCTPKACTENKNRLYMILTERNMLFLWKGDKKKFGNTYYA
jgi:hypothetical protein